MKKYKHNKDIIIYHIFSSRFVLDSSSNLSVAKAFGYDECQIPDTRRYNEEKAREITSS